MSSAWWTPNQLDTIRKSLTSDEYNLISTMSTENIVHILKTTAQVMLSSPLDAKLSGLRTSIISDLVNTLGTPITTSVGQLQATLQTIDTKTTELITQTQRLPEAIETHRLRPRASAHVGKLGESDIVDILKTKYQDVVTTASKTAAGDIRVNKRLLVEVKTYKTPVPLKEYDKFIRDIVFSKEVACAMFISTTPVASPDINTPLHYMVKRLDSNRVIPVAIVTGVNPHTILTTTQLLLTHADALDSINGCGEINKTLANEILQLVFDATADIRDLVAARESLSELNSNVTRTIQLVTNDLCELERKFHLRLITIKNKILDMCGEEPTLLRPLGSPEGTELDATLDKLLVGCHVSKVEARRVMKAVITKLPGVSPKHTSKYVSLGNISLHFAASSTTFRLLTGSITRAKVYELMDIFSTRSYIMAPTHLDITLDDTSVDDIITHCI